MASEPLIAVFVDFENLAIGVRDMKWGDFQVELVIKRLLEKGRIVFKRSYCDWSNYRGTVREFHRPFRRRDAFLDMTVHQMIQAMRPMSESAQGIGA